MHRNKILALIDEYQRRHPSENDVVRLSRFVRCQPRCFERDCFDDGHVTGSAWLVDNGGSRVLLTRHRKLGKWLQLGGHSDGQNDPLVVARREAEEESGLSVRPVVQTILDIDVHTIPPRGRDPKHLHYDVRFALQVVGPERFRVSDESLDLEWIDVDDIKRLTTEESVLRMARKFSRLNFSHNP
jgi:8-oxo-dGTP pyrophosphatase MutT (NUDIX family)